VAVIKLELVAAIVGIRSHCRRHEWRAILSKTHVGGTQYDPLHYCCYVVGEVDGPTTTCARTV
jgi:hypothetical protein